MKRKLFGAALVMVFALNFCAPQCERFGGNCTLVKVNNQPRIIYSK